MPSDDDIGRRTFIKGAGGAAAGAAMTGQASAKVDDDLDTAGDAQEVLVVFRSREQVDRLDELALPQGYYKYKALPYGYAQLTGSQIREVAAWPQVEYVQGNHEIEWHNADAREVTEVEEVQRSGYTGETVHAAVVDSGIDGDHPAFRENLEHNYRFQNPFETEMWRDVGPANTGGLGHGTHVSGSVAGGETEVDRGESDHGMAPDASLTVYSTTIGAGLVGVTGAYDDIIAKQRAGEHDIQVINNSYGASAGNDYDPAGAHQRATWEAFKEGIVSVFSAGNAGPSTNTMGDYAAGPHVLSSAATNDGTEVTDFSSRGRKPSYSKGGDGPNYDRMEALEQVEAFYNAGLTTEERRVKKGSRSGTLGVAGTGLVPIVDPPSPPSTPVSGSVYQKLEAPPQATLLTLSVGWSPNGDNDVYLRKGAKDGKVVAQATTFTGNPETIRTEIDGGTTYWVEIRPFLNAVSEYTMNFEMFNVPEEAIPPRPYGVHRPSVGTPGRLVMSTQGPEDPYTSSGTFLVGGGRDEIAESGQEPYYNQLTGTSMSGPILAGTVALVYDAYRQEHLEWPDPIEVIATIEATASKTASNQKPYNIGAGFVNALEAVERAVEDDLVSREEYAEAVDLVD